MWSIWWVQVVTRSFPCERGRQDSQRKSQRCGAGAEQRDFRGHTAGFKDGVGATGQGRRQLLEVGKMRKLTPLGASRRVKLHNTLISVVSSHSVGAGLLQQHEEIKAREVTCVI